MRVESHYMYDRRKQVQSRFRPEQILQVCTQPNFANHVHLHVDKLYATISKHMQPIGQLHFALLSKTMLQDIDVH